MKTLKKFTDSFGRELKIYQLVLKDKRTPKAAKLFLSFAVGYFLSPVDLIPDFIPIIGHLDDLIIVPVLVWIAIKLVPKSVIDDLRQEVILNANNNEHSVHGYRH